MNMPVSWQLLEVSRIVRSERVQGTLRVGTIREFVHVSNSPSLDSLSGVRTKATSASNASAQAILERS